MDFGGFPGSLPASLTLDSKLPEVEELFRLIERTPTYRGIVDDESLTEKEKLYLAARYETFSRAYAQYIAWRGGDRGIMRQVNMAVGTSARQWGHNEFVPVAEAMDRLFLAQGWIEDDTQE